MNLRQSGDLSGLNLRIHHGTQQNLYLSQPELLVKVLYKGERNEDVQIPFSTCMKRKKNKNIVGDRDRDGVALIASTTLPAGFKTEAVRRGETGRLMGTERGPVIFQRSSHYLPRCLRAQSPLPGVQPVHNYTPEGSNQTGRSIDKHTCHRADRRAVRGGQRDGRAKGTQCPQAARDIAAPLNSIMTASSTAHVKIYS